MDEKDDSDLSSHRGKRTANKNIIRSVEFESAYMSNTYSTYTAASERAVREYPGEVAYDPNSLASLSGLVPGVSQLLIYLTAPYSSIGGLLVCLYSLNYYPDQPLVDSSVTLYAFTFCIINLFVSLYYYHWPVESPITGCMGVGPFGATVKPDLYFSDKSSRIRDLLKLCPMLLSDDVKRSALPLHDERGKRVGSLEPTPWMLSGDMRTIFPFCAFSPQPTPYVRRWVRVPLMKGPLSALQHCDEGGTYEAVAVDWSPPPDYGTDADPAPMCMVILAGLTGGSSEGYVLDMVNSVNKQGWHAFVMLGRGLSGTHCESDAFFHGARTTDLQAVVRVVRTCMPLSTKICVAGISMGGIIVFNAFAKGEMEGIADVGCCIGGTFDTNRNRQFLHSRDRWQGILSQGLKEAFGVAPGCVSRLQRLMGPTCRSLLDGVYNVSHFDEKVVTPLNGFRDGCHYYEDMTPTADEWKNVKVPFLAMHARDDPILHVDSMPHLKARAGAPTDQLVVLVTETGGHVGWPLGVAPWIYRWHFQNELLLEFCNGVMATLPAVSASAAASASASASASTSAGSKKSKGRAARPENEEPDVAPPSRSRARSRVRAAR